MYLHRHLLLKTATAISLLTLLTACVEEEQLTGAAAIANHVPSISGDPASSIQLNTNYEFTPAANDADGDSLTFTIQNKPDWANFNNTTGTMSGTPGVNDVGVHANIVIAVSDGTAQTSLSGFSVLVYQPTSNNSAPAIGGTPGTQVFAASAYSFTPNATDPDNNPVVFSITNRPSWASFDTSTGTLSGTPQGEDVGSYNNIVITVSDGSLSASLVSFAIEVEAPVVASDAPQISGTPSAQVTAGQAYVFSPTASDPEGDALTFSIANRPSWASFNTSTGRLSGTPQSANAGSYSGITISVSDGVNTVSLPAFSITVNASVVAPVAQFSANPTSGNVVLTVNFSAAQSSNIVEYRWDFGDGNSTFGPTQTHIYNQAGSYSARLTVRNSSGATAFEERSINVFAAVDNSGVIVPDGVLFYDDFDYTVGRNDANAISAFQNLGGWNHAKTQQAGGSGRGYLYTTNRIPGYAGAFPGSNSNQVLAIEARPATMGGQTDFYLQYGCAACPANTIPGNVWFQFWIYINRYDDPANQEDQLSLISSKNKFIYPCNGSYPCNSNKWLLEMGSISAGPLNDSLSNGNAFLYNGDRMVGSPNYSGGEPWMRIKFGQQDTSEYMAANRWTLVKIHFDTTRTSGNVFEMWMKPMGGSWVKVAEWIGGVTPNFTWDIPSSEIGGHRVIRMPTTIPGGIGAGDQLLDSWIYMDDFAIAGSQNDLPVYPY